MATQSELQQELRRSLEAGGVDTDAAQTKAGRAHFVIDDDGNVTDVSVTIASPVPKGTDAVKHAAHLIQSTGVSDDDDDSGDRKTENRFDRIREEQQVKQRAEQDRKDRAREVFDRLGASR